MGSAREITASDFKTRINLELRNKYEVEWEEYETLAYLNKWLEFIHSLLVEFESDLVKTGSGSFPTVAGTEVYDLSGNDMGDFWAPVSIWLSGLEEIEMVSESERMPHVILKEQGATAYDQPTGYYLEGDNIGLIPFPDQAYTVKVKYIPEFSPLSSEDGVIPFKNLFNLVLEEGTKIIAKNRENYGSNVDSVLMELFQDRALSILRKRQKQSSRLVVS